MATNYNSDNHGYYLSFTSPLIPDSEDKVFYSSLGKYFYTLTNLKNDKLFLRYKEGYGKVYYSDPQSLTILKANLPEHNNYKIKFLEIEAMPQTDNGFVAHVKNKLTDINGTPVALFEGDNSKFISVDDAKKGGYVLYNSANEAKHDVQQELQDFLTMQAALFIKIKNLKYTIPNDFIISVTAVNSNKNLTKAPNSFAQSSPGTSQAHAKQSPKNGFSQYHNNRKSSPMNNYPKGLGNKENVPNGLSRSESKNSVNSNSTINSPTVTQAINAGMTPRQLLHNLNKKISNTPTESRPPSSGSMENVVTPVKTNVTVQETVLPTKSFTLTNYPTGLVYAEKMKTGVSQQIEFLQVLNDTSFIGYVICAESINFESVLNETVIEHELLVPSVGQLVLINHEEKLSRAYILQILNDGTLYKVAAIEYGQVVDVENVYEVPETLLEVDEFVFVGETDQNLLKKIQEDGSIVTTSTAHNVIVTDDKIPIKCSRWVPLLEEPVGAQQVAPPVIQKVYTSIPSSQEPITVSEQVKLCGFNSGYFFLRNKAMHGLITKMNSALQNSDVETLNKPPIVGQYVLQKMKDEYRRCVVKNMSPQGDNVVVEHLDYYQSEDTVQSVNLFNFNSNAEFGLTLFKARLRYFEEREYTPCALILIMSCIGKKFSVSFIQNDVVDFLTNKNISFSKLLLDLDKRTTIDDLPKIDVELNQEMTLDVWHVSDDDILHVQPVDKATQESTSFITELMSAESKDLEPVLNLVEGSLCVNYHDGGWSRAEVKEINGDKARIYFIDFGNYEEVTIPEEVRALPDKYLKFGPFVLMSVLTEDSLRTEPLADLHSKTYKGIIVKKTGDLHHIKLLREVQ